MLKAIVWIITTVTSLSLLDANAQQLEPLEPAAFDLGKQSVIFYYVDNDGTYDVVAMVGPNVAIEGPVVRHLFKLEADERHTVLIGGKRPVTEMSYIEIEREGDTLSVAAREAPGGLDISGLR